MRNRIDLAGAWQAVKDPENTGKSNGWQSWPQTVASQAEALDVPAIWNRRWPDYVGVVFCHRAFKVPADWAGRRIALHFEGVNYFSELWLNGQRLGEHEGGYTPFEFDITDHVKTDADNTLVVRVIDPPAEDAIEGMTRHEIPSAKETWYFPIGGIHGEVYLECRAAAWLENPAIVPDLEASCARMTVALNGGLETTATVVFDVLDADQNVVASIAADAPPSKESASAVASIPQPELWTPDHPYLYTARIRLEKDGETLDEISERFGMREFAIRDGRFYLNGEAIIIKGVLLQPHYPLTSVIDDPDLARRELEMMKAANMNMVRAHVRPAPPMYLDLADEIGLLVYQETALGFLRMSDRARRRSENEIREVFLRDRNHAAVVMWGLFNEAVGLDPEFRKGLLEYSMQFDETRPVIDDSGLSCAFTGHFVVWTHDAHVIGGGLAEPELLQDVHFYPWSPLPTRAFRWLSAVGNPAEMAASETAFPCEGKRDQWYAALEDYVGKQGKAVFISEYGSSALTNIDAVLERFGDDAPKREVDWTFRCRDMINETLDNLREQAGISWTLREVVNASQDAQAAALRRMTEALRINPNASGLVATQWNDVSFEQYAGIVDHWREPKAAYHALAKAFAPCYLVIRADRQAAYTDKPLCFDVIVVNDAPARGRAELSLSVENDRGRVVLEETRAIELGRGIQEPIAVEGPMPNDSGLLTVRATLTVDGTVVAENTDRLWAYPPVDFARLNRKVGRIAPDERLNPFLKAVETAWDDADVLIIEQPQAASKQERENAAECCRNGKTVILLNMDPEEYSLFAGEPIAIANALPGLPFPDDAQLVMSGSFFIPRHHYVLEDPLFEGLPANPIIDEEYRDLVPAMSVGKIDWDTPAGAMVFPPDFLQQGGVGLFSDVARRQLGEGLFVFSQFFIRDHVGSNPVADRLLFNLLRARPSR